MVAFGAQALAAYAGGAIFSRLGYGPGLAAAAALVVFSAALFLVLLRGRSDTIPA